MKATDARALPEAALEVLRQQAHRLRRQGNKTWPEIAAIVGVHVSTLMSWARRFGVGADKVLGPAASARRGRRFGEGRTLELADEVGLRQALLGGPPSVLGLPYALWSRRAVQQAVKAKFGLDMPIRTVGEYLRRWGLTPQRPAKRALEQQPEQVRQWLEVDYPALLKRAKAEQGQLHWADETAVRQDTAWVRGYAPAGCTPVLAHATCRPSPGITLISALSNQGQLRFALHDAAINAERFIDFMHGLVHDTAPAKVFLIVDRLPAHRAGKVRDWLADKADRIELVYLPPYAPQLNPDEWLNRDLKTELRMRPATRDRDTLKAMASDFLHALSALPQRVMGYFSHGPVAYASAETAYCV